MLSTKTWIVLAIVVGGAFAFPYVMKSQMGEQMEAMIDTTLSTEQTRQTYYKWQDANGSWHFGEKPPAGANAIAVSIDTAANILAPVKAPEPKATLAKAEPKEDKIAPQDAFMNPAAAKQAMEDAKQLQEMLNQRTKDMDALMQN